MLPRIRRLLGDVAVEKGLMSSGGEGRFLDKNSGFMYPSHYELGPPPRLTKLAVRARREAPFARKLECARGRRGTACS